MLGRARRRALLGVVFVGACGLGVGGPIDRRWPAQERALRSAPSPPLAGGSPVIARLVGISSGAHLAGVRPGCGGGSEAGVGCEGARAGDVFSSEIVLRLDGVRLAPAGREAPAGVPLDDEERLPSRAEAEELLDGAHLELCWDASGRRVAARAAFSLPSQDTPSTWGLVERTDRGARWGLVEGARLDCATVAATGAPASWNGE